MARHGYNIDYILIKYYLKNLFTSNLNNNPIYLLFRSSLKS